MNDPEKSSNPSGGRRSPDYDLDDARVVTSNQELRAMFHDLRGTILDLTLERAATVAELAEAIGRPKSTVAYHVGVLVEASMLKVVRTRRVRAIEERFYGRTARIFNVGAIQAGQLALIPNYLHTAAAESVPAHQDDNLRAFMRHAWISEEQAAAFWRRVYQVVDEYSQLPRDGDRAFRLLVALYPIDYPTLPDPDLTDVEG